MTSSTLSIPELRAQFTGQVIGPGDAEYDAARTVFTGDIDRRPAVIIRPADTSEVVKVVGLARDTGLELAIRSGGHSGPGHSTTDGGIVLDLAALRAIDIDGEARTAWAETGLTAGEYATAAAEHGFVTGFGDVGVVGLGGITLGGGVGYLSRKYGLTVDSLLAAEIVTADGQVLQVDADNHPDLFWAIRGGGGNFGVATRFKFQLHELESVYGGMLVLPVTADVVHGFLAAADAAPDELSTIINIMPAPPMPFLPAEYHGKLVLTGFVCYAGPAEDGEKALAPFRALATPIADLVRQIPYPEIFTPLPEGYRPTATARSFYLDGVDRDAAELIVDRIQNGEAPMRAVQLRVLGGAVSRVSDDATAYAHRQRLIMGNIAAFYEGPDEFAARDAWVQDFTAALLNGGTGVYVNFLADEGAERVREAYPGTTWDRLAAVKRQYDPSNLFRLNQNIPPAENG